jgi:MFS family permease
MAATLHISDKQASLLSGLFFLGYLAFQLPGAAFARKHSATKLVFVALIAWGSFAALTGVIRIFWPLAVDRFLLGVAESVILPAMLVLLTGWFTVAERSRANTVLILGNPVTVLWMSLITGYLIDGFGWQKTFVIEGVPSIAWALVWIAVVSDRPAGARWMTPEAAEHLEGRALVISVRIDGERVLVLAIGRLRAPVGRQLDIARGQRHPGSVLHVTVNGCAAHVSLCDQAAGLGHRHYDQKSGCQCAYLQSNASHAFFSPGPSTRA